jgi:hypothetical protein
MEAYPVQKGFVTLKGKAIAISEKSLLQHYKVPYAALRF